MPRSSNHPIEKITGEKFYGEGYEDCDRRVPEHRQGRRLLGWRRRRACKDTLRITMQYYYETYAQPAVAVQPGR